MNLRKIGVIAWHEYVTNIRRVGFIFVTLLFPVMGVIALVIATLFSGQATKFLVSQFLPEAQVVGIVDQAHLFTPIPEAYAKIFQAFPDEAAAKRALLANHIRTYYVIAADYVQSGKVTAYAKGLFETGSASDEASLETFLVRGLLTGKVDDATLTRAAKPAKYDIVTLDAQGEKSAGGALSVVSGFIAPYVFSILLFMAVFSSSGYLLRSVSEEKESRVIEIILSSVSPTELLAGKVIGLGAVGLTQVGVWLGSSFALSGGVGALFAGAVMVLNPGAFMLAAVYFLLGYLLFGAIMATAGSLGTNVRESQQIAGIFSFMAAIPWFFAGILFANPNAMLARVLSYFPLTAPTMMMLRLPMTQVPVEDIVISLSVLVVSVPLALWAGAKIFRVGLLMYGKRPTLREIWRALRQA